MATETMTTAPSRAPAQAGPRATAPPPRTVGETSDSPQRPAQRMHDAALAFDLAHEIDGLHHEPSWQRGDRNAKTLVQERGLRVVLVALQPQARMVEHESHAQVTVHVITGRLRAHLADRTIEVAVNRLLSIEAGVAHELEALEESAFLLTIAGLRSSPTARRKAANTAAHAARAG
jgi:quercetin dioxygenase-like cupin family protein